MCHFADMLEINFGLNANKNNAAVCLIKYLIFCWFFIAITNF